MADQSYQDALSQMSVAQVQQRHLGNVSAAGPAGQQSRVDGVRAGNKERQFISSLYTRMNRQQNDGTTRLPAILQQQTAPPPPPLPGGKAQQAQQPQLLAPQQANQHHSSQQHQSRQQQRTHLQQQQQLQNQQLQQQIQQQHANQHHHHHSQQQQYQQQQQLQHSQQPQHQHPEQHHQQPLQHNSQHHQSQGQHQQQQNDHQLHYHQHGEAQPQFDFVSSHARNQAQTMSAQISSKDVYAPENSSLIITPETRQGGQDAMDYSHFQFHANMASGAAFDASQTVSHTVPQSMTRYTMGGVDMQQMQTDNTHMAPNALVHDGYNYHGHITNTSYASSGAVDPMHMNTPSAHTQLGMVVGQTLPDSMVAVACLPMDSINTQRPLEMGNMHMSSQPIGVRFSSGNVHMQEEHNQNLLMAMEPSNCQGSDVGDQNMGRMGWMSQSDPIDNHMFSSHSDFANSQQREGDFTRETLANNNVCAGAALSQTQGLLNNDSCLVNIPHGGFLPISLQKNEPGAISIPSMPSADMAHTTQGPAQLPAQMQQQLQQQAISANMQHQPTDSYGGSFQQPQIQMQQQSQMSRQSDNVMSTYNHNADGRLSQGNMPMLNASGAWSVADTTMNAIQTMQGQALHGVWLLPGQQQSSVNTMSNGTNNSVNLLSSDAMSVGHTGGVPTSSTSISGWNVIGAAARDFNSSNASMYNAYIVPSPHAINIMQNPPALRNPAIQSNLDAAQQGQVEEKRKREGSLLAADAAANEADALQLVAGIRELCETLEQASDNVKHQIALRKDELAGIQGGGGRGKGAKGRGVKQGSKEKPEKSSKVGKGRGKKDAHPNIPNGPSGWPARGPIDVKTQAVIDRMNDPYTLQNNNLAGAFVSQPNAVGKTEMRGVGWGYEMPNDAVSKSSSDINDLIMAHEGGVSGLPHSSSQVPCFGATKQQLAATKTMQGATRPRKDGVLSKVQQAKSVGQGPAAVIMKTRKQILDNHAVAPAKAGKKRGGESTAAGDTSAPAMRSVNAILEQLGGFATTATPTVVGAHTSGAPGYHGASQTCSMVRPHPPVDNGAALLKSSALMVGGEAANAEHTKASNENSHTGRRENWNRPAQRHDKTFTNTLETATNTLETASNTLETAANTLGHDKTGTNTLGVAGQRRGKMSSTSLSTSNVRPGAFECALRPQRWCAVSAGDTLASGEKNEKSDSVDDVKDVPLNPTGKKDSKGLPASGKTLEVLIQASMMTILYDASRNLTLKVDDWGVWYLLAPFGGSNDQRKGMRWTLLETGSWISPGEWHSMSGVNRLVCDVACTGGEKEGASAPSVRRWKEQRYDACLGEFEEKRRDLFCAFNVGQDKGCVYRLTDQQLLRAVCGNQLRVLNLQTPALLDALRWVVLEQGSWQVRQGRFVWVSNEAQGHSFEPLDLSTELGRQQRALAADKDGNVAGVKRARLEHGRNTGLKKSSACSSLGGKARQPNRSECMPNREAVLKNGIILSRGKTRVGLGQGSSLRSPIKSSRSRGLGATGAAVKMASMGEQGTRISASVIAAQIRQKSKLQKSRRIVHSRETSRGPEGECESDRTADSADALKKHTSASDLQDGDNILHSKRGDGSHNKDKSKASDEDLQLSAARPKRKRTGAPVVESEEAAKVARKMARQKREQEKKALNEQLVLQGLCLVEIPADGHCLFSAINDQLKRSNHDSQRQHTYKTLRREAAKYMLENKEYFRDFLLLENDTFEAYCRRIGRTNTWGGQHEIIALCHVLRRNIEVFRHDMSIQCFPDPETDSRAPYTGPPLRVSYHMHEYSGGEHYNSIVEANEIGKPTRGFRKRHNDSAVKENSDDKEEGASNSATACVSHSDSDDESDDTSAEESSATSKKHASIKDDDESWDPQSLRNGKKPRPGKGKTTTKEPAASTPSNVEDDDAADGRHKSRHHAADECSKGTGKQDSVNGKSSASSHAKAGSKVQACASSAKEQQMMQSHQNGPKEEGPPRKRGRPPSSAATDAAKMP